MYDNYLSHHGIKGQRWGFRRDLTKSASEGASRAANIAERSGKNAKTRAIQKMDVSQMTDTELQKAINRMNLERNYKTLSSEKIGSGRKMLSSYLQTAGDVLAVGSSAASIALAIHELKKLK